MGIPDGFHRLRMVAAGHGPGHLQVYLQVVMLCVAAVHGLRSEFFRAGNINEDARAPHAVRGKDGIVTVGHFRGVFRQGHAKKCNGFTCIPLNTLSFESRGKNDLFVTKYNASRVLQWSRTAGGAGDDKAQAVATDFDGNVLVAGYFSGFSIDFGMFSWDKKRIRGRTALSRTLFLSMYSPNGTVLFAKEIASCGVAKCDITGIGVDETGTVLTGRYRGRTSFGLTTVCSPMECLDVERGHLLGGDPTLKSLGSGTVYPDLCWAAKYDVMGELLWYRNCFNSTVDADRNP